MAESKLAVASLEFAVKILKLCDSIKGHYSIINQLERSSTSIGANIREANYAHSKPDFVSKLQISLKECYETEYWLELMLKLKEGYIVREVAGQIVALPTGDDLDLNVMITLNGTGKFLWELIEKGSDVDSLVAALLAEYDVDEATARAGVERFVAKLNENGFLA